jgi:hypothetical protein
MKIPTSRSLGNPAARGSVGCEGSHVGRRLRSAARATAAAVNPDVIPIDVLERSHWQEVSANEFQAVLEMEVAAVPELTESTFHMVAGVLLSVWSRLPDETVRVYRL